jgi:hypothetical protein
MKTVLQQNYFHSDGSFYKPNKGIAMGSPLSSIATELICITILRRNHNKTLAGNK